MTWRRHKSVQKSASHSRLDHFSFFSRIVLDNLQHTATICNTLQHTATHCNTLQHTATHCNTDRTRQSPKQNKCRVTSQIRMSHVVDCFRWWRSATRHGARSPSVMCHIWKSHVAKSYPWSHVSHLDDQAILFPCTFELRQVMVLEVLLSCLTFG